MYKYVFIKINKHIQNAVQSTDCFFCSCETESASVYQVLILCKTSTLVVHNFSLSSVDDKIAPRSFCRLLGGMFFLTTKDVLEMFIMHRSIFLYFDRSRSVDT